MNPKNTGLRHMPQLDGLRTVSVFCVLYTHWVSETYWLGGIYWGELGVRCFFVISGFLITTLLLNDLDLKRSPGEITKGFFVRRFIRLAPALYLSLLVCFIFRVGSIRETWPWHASYMSNIYFTAKDGWDGPLSHFWSLAVEQQFYLLWPFLLIAVPRSHLVVCFSAIVLGSVVFRGVWFSLDLGQIGAWVLMPGCADALALGALVAVLKWDGSHLQRHLWAFPLIGLLLFATRWSPPLGMLSSVGLQMTGAALFFAWLVYRASAGFNGLVGACLENRTVVFLGAISYGIYVFHNIVPDLFQPLYRGVGFSPLVSTIMSAVLTIGIAAASWRFLEMPLRAHTRPKVNAPA